MLLFNEQSIATVGMMIDGAKWEAVKAAHNFVQEWKRLDHIDPAIIRKLEDQVAEGRKPENVKQFKAMASDPYPAQEPLTAAAQ